MRYTAVGDGETASQSAAGPSQYGSLQVSVGEVDEGRGHRRRRTALVVMVTTVAVLLMGLAALAAFYSPGRDVSQATDENNTPTLRGPFGEVDYKHKSKKEKKEKPVKEKPAEEVPAKTGKGPAHAHKKPEPADDDDDSPAPAPKHPAPAPSSAGKGSSSTKTDDSSTPAKKTPAPAPLPSSWPSHCRNCTASECKTLQCNADATPFACVKGMAKDGCSKVESVFLNPSCTDCCSLKSCATLWPGCGQCSSEECDKWKVPCGDARPYVCLTGDAHGGCSNSTSDWGPAAYFEGVCTKCCDLGTCAKAPPCGKCTKAECLQYQVGCGFLRPYACTEGDAHGGCAETEAFWQNAEDLGICSRCCNTLLC